MKNLIAKYQNHFLLIIWTGILSGLLSSLFLYLLDLATKIRGDKPYLIWGLPILGIFLGFVIPRIHHSINAGVPDILGELDHESEASISLWLAPFVLFAAIFTHLFGGSAGREGVGVIMGASVSQVLPRLNDNFHQLKNYLLYAGMSAGFASIFGTPLAGILFTFELQGFKEARNITLITTTILSSYLAYGITVFLGTHHQEFQVSLIYDYRILFYLLIATITSAMGAYLFYKGVKLYSVLMEKLIPNLMLKLFIGGLLVSLIVYFCHGYQYIGIGVDIIAESFLMPKSIGDFLMKALLTMMTIAIGFKGGEVTPLFFMGATFSNSVGHFFGFNNYGLSSSLGMVALFGAAAGVPLSAAVMGAEMFGLEVGLLCFISSLGASRLMRGQSLYNTKPINYWYK